MAPPDTEGRDRILRAGVLSGDANAWRALYDECFEPLYRYVRWRCARRNDWTDEIVQETWLAAVRGIRRYDPDQGSLIGWLRGIAANVLRNAIRRRQTEAARRRAAGEASSTVDPASLPAGDDDRGLRVAASLDQLPEHYEAVLRAKYLDGLSVADIAAAFGQSPKAVESLLTRAREAFRTAFQANAEGVARRSGPPRAACSESEPAAQRTLGPTRRTTG